MTRLDSPLRCGPKVTPLTIFMRLAAKPRKPLERHTPLKRSRFVRRHRYTGPSAATRQAVKERAEGRCERCGAPGSELHHVKPRRMGGSSDPAINAVENLTLLCHECHRWTEEARAQARKEGWVK